MEISEKIKNYLSDLLDRADGITNSSIRSFKKALVGKNTKKLKAIAKVKEIQELIGPLLANTYQIIIRGMYEYLMYVVY